MNITNEKTFEETIEKSLVECSEYLMKYTYNVSTSKIDVREYDDI